MRILSAGCNDQEKARVEEVVKRAFGPQRGAGPWNVSLVKLGDVWTVTVASDDARIERRNFQAPFDRLEDSLREVLKGSAAEGSAVPASAPRQAEARQPVDSGPSTKPPSPSRAAPPPTAPEKPKPEPLTCSCGHRFVVLFETLPGEQILDTPVACPSCWTVMQVPIAETASVTGDYRAVDA